MIACMQNKNYKEFYVDDTECMQFYLTKYLIPLLLLTLLLASCATAPQMSAEDALLDPLARYTKSANTLEQAAKLAPLDESLALPLAEAHFKAADAGFNQAESNTSFDPRKTIALYLSARDHAEKSLAALRPVLAKPDEGPGMLDKVKKLADAQYKNVRERQELQHKLSLSLLNQISDDKLQAPQAVLDKVLAETIKILAVNRLKPGSAYDEYVAYFPYADYVQEARDAKLEIEQLTIRQLEQNGYAQTEKRAYPAADLTFKRMATIFGGAERATAGNHAISAHKAFLKKDYETAFEALLAIRSVYPQSSFLTAYYDKTQKLLIDTQLVKVDALIGANKLPGLIDAFEKLGKLSKAAQGNADVITKIEQRNHKLRTLVATSLIRRATDLKKQDAMVYSSLILRNLRLARQFDPQQLVAVEEDAAKAQGITTRKTEMKVLVAYDGSAGIPQEWAKRLESDVFSALESSGVPGLNIVDRVSLKGGNARAPGVVDLAINGSIDAVDFSEKGRDAPRRRSSKYISGTRQIDNPAYPLAETAYHEAEAAYNSTKTAQENLKRECRRLDGAMARMICEAGVSYVSSSFKDNAYAKWKSTPQYLTQNIISSYQYDHYTVTLNGLVRSKCALIDNLSRAESKCTAINEKFKREGTIIANAQSTDTEGIRNAVEAPDMVNELENAYEQVVKSISAELVQMVSAQRAGRYCKLAESLKKPSDKLKSLEAASMCAFIIGDEDDKRRAELDAKLNAYLMISPAQVQAFGTQNKEQDAAWPAPAEVDDKDLKLAMMKMGVSR